MRTPGVKIMPKLPRAVISAIGACFLSSILLGYALLTTKDNPTSNRDTESTPHNSPFLAVNREKTNEALEEYSLERKGVPHGNIYFFEMSGRDRLTMEQLCAVESAAYHHPDVPVVLAVNNDHLKVDETFKTLMKAYPQIHAVQVDPQKWIKEAEPPTDKSAEIMEKLFTKEKQSSQVFNPHRAAQISDYVRYVTLYKYGGVYFDLDVIVLRPVLGKLGNCLGLQGADFVNQAVVVFDKGHGFLKDCVTEFGKRLVLDDRESAGGKMASELSRKWCNVEQITDAMDPSKCNGLRIMPISSFYPVPRSSWEELFIDRAGAYEKLQNKSADSYVIHYWNHESADTRIKFGSKQPLAQMAKDNCPKVSEAAAAGY